MSITPEELIDQLKNVSLTYVPNKNNKKRNEYFRDRPRAIIEHALLVLLARNDCSLESINNYLKGVNHE